MSPPGGSAMDSASRRAETLLRKIGRTYARLPVEVIEYYMDRPPADKNARKSWRPIFDNETRLYFTYIRLSWCWPICVEYAVRVDDNDTILHGEDGEPLLLNQETVARILGMRQPHVSRGLAALEAKKLIRVEGRVVYPQPSPKLTEAERVYTSTGMIPRRRRPGDPAQLPRSIRKQLTADLERAHADEQTSTGIFDRALKVHTRYLDELKHIRYEAKQGYKDLRTEIAILIDKNQNQSVDSRPDLNGSQTRNWRATQIRPKPNPCAQTAKPEESGGQSDEDLLVNEIRRMQCGYPDTPFGRKEFNPETDAGDRGFVRRILQELDGVPVRGFLLTVACEFKKNGHSPDMANGPQTLGLLVTWAKKYAERVRREAPRELTPQAARAADQSPEHTVAPQREEHSFAQPTAPPVPPAAVPPPWPMRPPSARTAVAARDGGSLGPCQHCSGRGYLLVHTGTEQVAGEELKTIAASVCDCSKDRKISYECLAAIERKEAKRRGPDWIAAHRPFDHAANSAAQTPAASLRP